ncbi:unnamed protein product [Effrenium voratum]|nr:unnamed protein product [Effrenium voratum]
MLRDKSICRRRALAVAATVVGHDTLEEEDEEETEPKLTDTESAERWRLAALGIMLCLFHLMATNPLPENMVFKGPVNWPYHHMRLTVFFGFGFPFLLQCYGGTSLRLQPLVFMVTMWLGIQCILLAITGLWLQFGLALALIVAVMALALPLRSGLCVKDFCRGAYQHLFDPAAKLRVKVYTCIFSVFPFGLSGPVFLDWEEVQTWVRWHPYNVHAELLWRGTFATFAVALFLTAANPKVNNSIVAFFAAHGVCHSVSMFIDNRIFPRDGNDNVEHLLEISIFMVIGVFHIFVGRAVWYLPSGAE